MKHLVDLDDELLQQAMDQLGTRTIKATVDEALRIATDRKRAELRQAIDGLAKIFADQPFDRSEAW